MGQKVEDVAHRIKRLHELGPNHEHFKLGDMDAEFLLSELAATKAKLEDEREKHQALLTDYTALKRKSDEVDSKNIRLELFVNTIEAKLEATEKKVKKLGSQLVIEIEKKLSWMDSAVNTGDRLEAALTELAELKEQMNPSGKAWEAKGAQ